MLEGKYILISGSASRFCEDGKLDVAIQFVRDFTSEVLVRGGGIVVLAGEEESTRDERGNPRIFDWVALREVQRHAERTTQEPRRLARLVMSEQAPESKIDDVNLDLLRRLEQRNVVERSHIRREMFTGGEYRQVMIDLADAMLAVGGGKGTYTAGMVMTELGKPVLPVDLKLGSIAEDGEGAIALLREMMSDPQPFFPNTHREAINQLALITMDRGTNHPTDSARTAAEILERELATGVRETHAPKAGGRLNRVARGLGQLPVVAAAIKIIEFIRGTLPFGL